MRSWFFWATLSWITLAASLVGALLYIALTHTHTERGKLLTEKCRTMPSYSYWARCNELHDGPACTFESRSRVQLWIDEIDTECSKDRPQLIFRFPVHEPEPEEHVIAAID